jgi:nitrogen fixation/metabolism regulation signal transduction histidine kinase
MATKTQLQTKIQELEFDLKQQLYNYKGTSTIETAKVGDVLVHLGQQIYQQMVKEYHAILHGDDTYGEIEENRTTYQLFAEMSFAAAEQFTKVFENREDN